MDVLIRTGFEKVTHEIGFQPQTVPKGIKLCKASHVRGVQEYRQNGVSFFIQAEVIRQASVNDTYNVQLNIDAARVVTSVSCTCVYNQSGRCKHVAALIHFVNNHASLSKTNFEQQWGLPTPKQFSKEKYSKGASFENMFKYMPLLDIDVPLPGPEEFESESSLKLMLIAEAAVNQDSFTDDIDTVEPGAFDQLQINVKKQDCEVCLLNIHNFVEDYVVYKSQYTLDDDIKQFLEAHIQMSSESIISLCTETMDQAMCDKWHFTRSYRFSASSTIHKIKIRKLKTVQTLLSELLYPNKVSLPSMQYGKINESNARNLYETMTGNKVTEVGVIVSKFQPWLCASPDGIVIEDGCISGLVEIKCPSSCEKKAIIDFEEKKSNVKYLTFVGNEVVLRKSDIYYTQCQVQMYVCGLSLCDLFVYSPIKNGSCIIPVYRDELFIKDVILKSENFYFLYFLPGLYAKTTEENKRCHNTIEEKSNRVFTGKNIQNTL